MATAPQTIRIKMRWWLKFYLSGVLLIARLTQCEPNWSRVGYWVGKGVKAEFC